MKFDNGDIALLQEALSEMEKGFSNLPNLESVYDIKKMRPVLLEAAKRMQDNYPYFHPYYAGQMLKPPHPIARLAYMLSLWINPNNHALDGGRASSAMEKEAVANLASLFGWETHIGHICGGGTMANLEALWVSGKLKPSMKIVASEQAHYTHNRISEVLGLDFEEIPCDTQARMNIEALKDALERGNIGTVVVTIGTTASGSIDPLPSIIELRKEYGFRIHADAAYGGYFTLADNLGTETRKAYDNLVSVDSLAIDPHKHGLQPYGCGCILYQDPGVGVLYRHDSPYTYFSSSELHLGEISMECSRPGASAVALWATQKFLPMTRKGDFASGLAKCRDVAILLYKKISTDQRFSALMEPELDIVLWTPKADRASDISKLSRKIFHYAAQQNLHLALCNFPAKLLTIYLKNVEIDQENITVLRSCLMKPEHKDWIDRIWSILCLATDKALNDS